MAVARPRGKAKTFVDEIKSLIERRFPDARFTVTRAPDTRRGVAIWTYTSADYEEVTDVVAERQFEIMLEEDVFIYVIPMPLEAHPN